MKYISYINTIIMLALFTKAIDIQLTCRFYARPGSR
jgi:hypothetical protein